MLDFVLSPCSPSSVVLPFACGTGSFLFVVGTSQAAPHVAGLGAFLDAQFGGGLDGEDLKDIVEDTADDVGSEEFFGEGRINVFAALTGGDGDDDDEDGDDDQDD